MRQGTIEEYRKLVPSHLSKKKFRDFLLNNYKLPQELDLLTEKVTNMISCPLRMNQNELTKIDYFVSQAWNKGVHLNRSAIVRDIYKELITFYTNNPMPPLGKMTLQKFKVPAGTKEILAKLVDEGERTYELASFIMEEYKPSNDFPSVRGVDLEELVFKTDSAVFEKLDNIADDFGFKKGGRAKIFRDAVVQFIKSYSANPPKKNQIETQLQKILEDFKGIENPEKIKEIVEEYLNDDK